MKKRILFSLLFFCFISTCFSQIKQDKDSQVYTPFKNIPDTLQEEVNTILCEMLDGVGLYTLLSDIKPMGSVFISYYKIDYGYFRVDSSFSVKSQKMVLEKIARHFKTLEMMSDEMFHFQFSPLKGKYSEVPLGSFNNKDGYFETNDAKTFKKYQIPEIIVLRKDLTMKKIKENAIFFKSINVDTSTFVLDLKINIFNGNKLLPSIAGARAYGYLFGYPNRAIDFFVKTYNDSITGIGIDRKGVSIPVYSDGSSNNFAYVIPINEPLMEEDNKIIQEAKVILDDYKKRRLKYTYQNRLDAITLIQDWYKEYKKSPAGNN